MAAKPAVVDVEESGDLIRLVDEMRESQEPRILRRHGEEVAVVTPLRPGGRARQRRRTREGLAAFFAAAGSWKGLVDTDRLIADIYADRDLEIERQPEL